MRTDTPLYEALCDPLNAIEFALEYGPVEVVEFLNDWRMGDWWREYEDFVTGQMQSKQEI